MAVAVRFGQHNEKTHALPGVGLEQLQLNLESAFSFLLPAVSRTAARPGPCDAPFPAAGVRASLTPLSGGVNR